MKFLELKNVTKVIKREVVLNDINLSINTGKIIGIVGPYSSGKTMLLRAIAGLVEIDQGSIALKGEAVGLNRQRTTKVGATIETPGFNPACTVLENLRFLASLDNVVGDREIRLALKKFNLERYQDKKVRDVFFGNILKLGIIQAFMEGQELVMLDEPTNGLDTASLDQLKLLLQDLRVKGHTVLVTAHDERFIDELADEVYQLDHGRIVDSWSHRAA